MAHRSIIITYKWDALGSSEKLWFELPHKTVLYKRIKIYDVELSKQLQFFTKKHLQVTTCDFAGFVRVFDFLMESICRGLPLICNASTSFSTSCKRHLWDAKFIAQSHSKCSPLSRLPAACKASRSAFASTFRWIPRPQATARRGRASYRLASFHRVPHVWNGFSLPVALLPCSKMWDGILALVWSKEHFIKVSLIKLEIGKWRGLDAEGDWLYWILSQGVRISNFEHWGRCSSLLWIHLTVRFSPNRPGECSKGNLPPNISQCSKLARTSDWTRDSLQLSGASVSLV